MIFPVADESDDDPRWCSTAELGEALAGWAARTAAAECRWLRMLAEFDLREGWRLDGQLSAAAWLVWNCGMSARTAREKLRVAHELRRRPAVAEAFGAARLSYCKVRALTRVTGAGEEADESLLALAEVATVADLDRVVRHWAQLQEQERGVGDYLARYGPPGGAGLPHLRRHDGGRGRAPGGGGRGGAGPPRRWTSWGRRFT